MSAPALISGGRLGFETMSPLVSFGKSLESQKASGGRLTQEQAKNIFDTLDADGSGYIEFDELKDWVVRSSMFEQLCPKDAHYQANVLLSEMDTDGDGTLNFAEFYSFLGLAQNEKDNLNWASRHYITSLPPAYPSNMDSEFSYEVLRQKLHRKVEQFTSADTDRLRQTIQMFRNQTIRSRTADFGTSEMRITPREFAQVLSWLGLFASREQSDRLFKSFDINGDGVLTVHEFLTRARPDDYPIRRSMHNKHYQPFRKQGLSDQQLKPKRFPNNASLSETVKARMQEFSQSFQFDHRSGRNGLLELFKNKDPFDQGYCLEEDLQEVLESVQVSVDKFMLKRLMQQFGMSHGKNVVFHYPEFVSYLFAHGDHEPKKVFVGTHTMDLNGPLPISTYQASMRPFGNGPNPNLFPVTRSVDSRQSRKQLFSKTLPSSNPFGNMSTEVFRMNGTAKFSRPSSSSSNRNGYQPQHLHTQQPVLQMPGRHQARLNRTTSEAVFTRNGNLSTPREGSERALSHSVSQPHF